MPRSKPVKRSVTRPDPIRAPTVWKAEDDEHLTQARARGSSWQTIAAAHFPNKSSNACRKRHERLMERQRNTENWDGNKLERLATAYMEMREKMWKMLAELLDEDWKTVESKCFERGIKTLQNASRTFQRQDKGGPGNDRPDDSGIADTSFELKNPDVGGPSNQPPSSGDGSLAGPSYTPPRSTGAYERSKFNYSGSTASVPMSTASSRPTPPQYTSFSIPSLLHSVAY